MDKKDYEYALRRMKEEIPRIVEHSEIQYSKSIAFFSSIDDEVISTILKCHLFIEQHINEYIATANPALGDISSARLTFDQKLKLMNSELTYKVMIHEDGLSTINKIRNRFAHRINHSFNSEDLSVFMPLLKFFSTIRKEPIPTGIDIIKQYTYLVCLFISEATNEISKKSPDLGITGLKHKA